MNGQLIEELKLMAEEQEIPANSFNKLIKYATIYKELYHLSDSDMYEIMVDVIEYYDYNFKKCKEGVSRKNLQQVFITVIEKLGYETPESTQSKKTSAYY